MFRDLFEGWDGCSEWYDPRQDRHTVTLYISGKRLAANRFQAEKLAAGLAQKGRPMIAARRRPLVGRYRMGTGK